MTLSFNQLLEIRKNSKGKKLKKSPKWLYPTNAERRYRALLQSLVKELSVLIKERLKPEIPMMLSAVESTYPQNDDLSSVNVYEVETVPLNTHVLAKKAQNDDFLDRLKGIIISIQEAIAPKVEQTINEMELIGGEISNYNQQQFQKINKSVFGIDIFVDQPYLRNQLELFSRQNSQLIKSIPEQELLQISGIVERGLVEGKRFTEVSKELQKRFGITKRRANLISRDQTAKLNASLTRLRQQSLGINTYEWQTSGDERVRDSHRVMDGKICKWDDPTVWLNESTGKWEKRSTTATKNQVGQDINCRCVALARLEEVLE